LQQQPARDGDEEGGSDDDDTEAVRRAEEVGAQQVTGKRKRNKPKGAGRKARQKQAWLEWQGRGNVNDAASTVQQRQEEGAELPEDGPSTGR
jgi:hypothetical protein